MCFAAASPDLVAGDPDRVMVGLSLLRTSCQLGWKAACVAQKSIDDKVDARERCRNGDDEKCRILGATAAKQWLLMDLRRRK